MRRGICGLLLLAACGALQAQSGNKDIDKYLEGSNLRFISRLDADLTSDGVPDAVVVSGDDRQVKAVVTVLFRRRPGRSLTDKRQADDFEGADSVNFELSPLGPPTVKAVKGILLVEHLVGGAFVRTEATYRYRFDGEEGRMRLIGVDAKRTSSTLTVHLSYNVLTGVRIFRKDNGPESKKTEKPSPVWMDLTRSADDLIDEALGEKPGKRK
jgi:hypothetical protein